MDFLKETDGNDSGGKIRIAHMRTIRSLSHAQGAHAIDIRYAEGVDVRKAEQAAGWSSVGCAIWAHMDGVKIVVMTAQDGYKKWVRGKLTTQPASGMTIERFRDESAGGDDPDEPTGCEPRGSDPVAR
jgi:hypothetical protein